ncbi:FtsW/RodA/SpoVE family cell cycle protein [Blattabacterium cuenoti]|uniref:FtsW/RodA/SpoVE family cell cycle protein n=1 Tax=Blattabacterium cuenoti TaxID=1653831 RepID=UPI00163C859C|nr:FtsW/RodA/SpoVE family cell cycle protein [Blattabacterium cuenoti]
MKLDIFIKKYVRGDKYLWSFISLLSIFSFLPVYSASINLVNAYGCSSNIVFYFLFKHTLFILIGYGILFFSQFINYKYIYRTSIYPIPFVSILLILTLIQGKQLHGVNASRWLYIPILNISFQTSNIAGLALFIYCSKFLYQKKNCGFIYSLFTLWFPIFFVIGLILPANGSTAVLIFFSICILLFIGGYPISRLIGILFMGILFATIYIYSVLKWGENQPVHRVFTWKSRIEKFYNPSGDNYQIQLAKSAIFLGKKFGRGPGKSVLKAFLPQSSSDFIYAIIIEEYGLIGGVLLLFIYLLILLRIIIIATKIQNYYCTLLVLSLGFPIITQAFINMGIVVGLFPVTGQNLPLISSGGTSMWVTFFSFGIILSVSKLINKKSISQ